MRKQRSYNSLITVFKLFKKQGNRSTTEHTKVRYLEKGGGRSEVCENWVTLGHGIRDGVELYLGKLDFLTQVVLLTTSTMIQDIQQNMFVEGLAVRRLVASARYTQRGIVITLRRVIRSSRVSISSSSTTISLAYLKVSVTNDFSYRRGTYLNNPLCRYLTQST